MPERYVNGNILTMDDCCPRVQALLVDGGRIVKRGSDAEVLACKQEGSVCVDLRGKTMMPGFVDGHSHFAGLASALSQCDLSRTGSFQEIISTMRAYIREREIPEGEWVVGTNYDHNFLTEKQHPNKTVLDQISVKHPVLIIHASSHMGVTNSMGLQTQNLTDATGDPAGGRYGRVDSTKELNGYMEENAFIAFRNAMPMPGIETLMELFRKAQAVYASHGITTVQEGMVTAQLFPLLQYAERRHVLYLDLVGYVDLENSAELLPEHPEYLRGYTNHFRLGGYKIFLDGSPQGRTAWMKASYENGENGYRGYPIKSDG